MTKNVPKTNEQKSIYEEYLKNNLTHKDFKDYERMVQESEGIISWEKLKKYSRFRDNWKLDWIYWEWDLNLNYKPITSLSKLKEIKWCLYLYETSIKKLSYLKNVFGFLDLQKTPIKRLPNLEKVLWEAYFKWSAIKSLPKLEYVSRELDLSYTNIKSLPKLEEVWFYLNLNSTTMKSIPRLKKVKWNLFLAFVYIKNLPKLEIVLWDLNLNSTPIKSIPRLKNVYWGLDIRWTSIKSLPELEEISEDLYLSWNHIESLPKLEKIWGNLYLSLIPSCNLVNILNEIRENNTEVWWKIMYDWIDFKPYLNWKSILSYLENFENELMSEELISSYKKEFITIYWTWRTRRDDKVKRILNIMFNLFYTRFVKNFLKYREKIALMKKNWVSEKEIEIEWYKIDKKLEEKFHEIWHYFWKEIKNRFLDEFRKEIKEINKN